jgi:hypothetical protein
LGFFGTRVGGVDDIADEDEGLGVEIAAKGVEFFLGASIG